ncbi:MAG: efflux RND transporter permease subunit, partial [Planctomycetaceae bacterium]
WMFRRPLVGIVLGLALPLLGFAAAATLKEQFFPPAVRDQITIEIELPADASLAGTRRAVEHAGVILNREERITATHWFLGRSAPTFFYNMAGSRELESRYAQGLIQLDSADDVGALVRKLQARLNHLLPGARVLVRQLGQGPPFPAPIELRIYSEDVAELQRQGETARRVLSQTPHVAGIRAELNETVPKLGIRVHEHEARLAGLSKAETTRQLDAALRGAPAGSILEDTERIPIIVRLPDRLRGRLDRLRTLELRGQKLGSSEKPGFSSRPGFATPHVPLDAVADVSLAGELSAISHRNGRRVNIVRGFVDAGELPAEVLKDYRRRMQPVFDAFPPGCTQEFGGEASHRDEAVANLLSSVGVLSVMLAATLVLSLSSFRMAGVIALVGALSVGLGVLALKVWGSPFGFMAIIGTMGLVGVAINDSIVVLTALRNSDATRTADPEAVSRIVVGETRHVLATTLTTIAGFLPLLLNGGDFWPPLAIAIAGGVAGATILALSLVPASYILLTRQRQPAVLSDAQPAIATAVR